MHKPPIIFDIFSCELIITVLPVTVYHAIYLESLTECHLAEKLAGLYAILPSQILEILVHGSLGIHVLVTDLVSEVLWNVVSDKAQSLL